MKNSDRPGEGRSALADDNWYTRSFDSFYLELYRHRDDREAATFARLLRAEGVAGPICEVACGPGRFLRALKEIGESVYGLDLSAPLLERAGAVLGESRLVRGDMRSLPFRTGRFGAVLLLFTSYGYFRRVEEDQRVLAEAARLLRPGGRFVLDFFNRETTLRSLVKESRREVAGIGVVERRWIDPEGPFLVKTIEADPHSGDVPGLPRGERVRLYSPDDLRAQVAAQGLTVQSELGDYVGEPFDPHRSARFILVARREEKR